MRCLGDERERFCPTVEVVLDDPLRSERRRESRCARRNRKRRLLRRRREEERKEKRGEGKEDAGEGQG